MSEVKNKRQADAIGESLSSKNKRQFYLWDENKEFYEGLGNKSKLINLLIRKYREEHEDGESATN
jgi:hypothetical protein